MPVPPARAYALGRADEATHPESIRAALAEFISTFIFVFAAAGSAFALNKMFGAGADRPASGLVLEALASGLALFAAMAGSINISRAHVNPAVTFGALVGGRISLVRAIYYWVAQLLGAVIATLLLKLLTAGMRPVGLYLASGEGKGNGMLLELVMTFGLVYTHYATINDPRRGSMWIMAPLAVGLILAANIFVGGPLDGAAMNPARAFGPALVGGRWAHHWIYWVGPLIGGTLAALVYEFLIIPIEAPRPTQQPLAPEDY